MKWQAVMFDLDGTLLDSIEDIGNSMNSVLQRFGLKGHDTETYKYFIGDGIETLVLRSIPEERRDDSSFFSKCLSSMRAEYGRRWKEKTHPYDGIPELLDILKLLKVKMTILSNKPDDTTQIAVAELLPNWTFDAVLGARPLTPKKPDPTGALEIAERLHVSPAEFLYLGDTGIDMKTANAAGMYAVGALWGFRKADELLAAGAKVLIKEPTELTRLF